MEEVDYCPELNNAFVPASNVIDESLDIQKSTLLKWKEISIPDTDRRYGLNSIQLQDTYTVYGIETKIIDETREGYGKAGSCVWRRYSEFETLHHYLEIIYTAVIVPPIPEKRASFTWYQLSTDRFHPDFINRRRVALENFLLRVASHSVLSQDEIFISFLNEEDDEDKWTTNVNNTDYKSKGEWKLKEYSASLRVRQTNEDFEQIKYYAHNLNLFISSILKLRSSMMESTYGIHKLHANYGKVFSEWSSIEDSMADYLQMAGHHMDNFSQSVDGVLEDEEQFADQMKEYIGFSEALRSICRKQELMQLQLEKQQDLLLSKQNAREQLITPTKSSLRTKIFGEDNQNIKDNKIKILDEEIKIAMKQLDEIQTKYDEFIQETMKEYNRFNRQKTKDFNDIFTNYAILQIERMKKGITTWQTMKESAFNNL